LRSRKAGSSAQYFGNGGRFALFLGGKIIFPVCKEVFPSRKVPVQAVKMGNLIRKRRDRSRKEPVLVENAEDSARKAGFLLRKTHSYPLAGLGLV
jgi:hypothetical protein